MRKLGKLARLALVGSILIAKSASASTFTYDFSAAANGGPLSGDVFDGVFTVDSSVVAAGSGAISITSFDVLGTILNDANDAFSQTPQASFAASGALTGISDFVVLSTARANNIGDPGDGYALPGSISSFTFTNGFNYGTDPTGGETFLGGAVVQVTAAPEPASAALFGAGLAGLLGLRSIRRRRREPI